MKQSTLYRFATIPEVCFSFFIVIVQSLTPAESNQFIICHNPCNIEKHRNYHARSHPIRCFHLFLFNSLCKQEIRTHFLPELSSDFSSVVDPRGVEPLSEDQTTRASPSAVCVLTFPPEDARRQAASFSSFIKSHRPQSLRRLVPCLYDADGLRRRRLRVDDRH